MSDEELKALADYDDMEPVRHACAGCHGREADVMINMREESGDSLLTCGLCSVCFGKIGFQFPE
jgi:hypothetical protein